ncbi:Lysosomal-trafficking regulator [Nymphon striatum]|nr:Lysosomal-trafficking regulator [Nymphon striatum]
MVDSAIGLSEGSNCEKLSSSSKKNYQSFEIYKDLLQQNDEPLQKMICNHLSRLAIYGEERVKKEVFLHVALPIFFSCNFSEKSEKHIVLTTILVILPKLLQIYTNRVLFLNRGGLKNLNLLLENIDYRPQILRIIEVLIRGDLNENFNPIDPKYQSRLLLEHKNNVIKKSAKFTSKINHKINLTKSDELKTRKFSLINPVICVFDIENELIEAFGEELARFTKPEIEFTFNLFNNCNSNYHVPNQDMCFQDLQELRDLWVSMSNLLRGCKYFKIFMQDPSNMNILETASDLLNVIGSEFSKFPAPADFPNCKVSLRHIMKNLKDELNQFEPVNAAGFKQLLDMLLHCVLGKSFFCRKYEESQYISYIPEYYFDENDGELLKHANTELSEASFGYDGDAESTEDQAIHFTKITQLSKNNRFVFPEACRLLFDLLIQKFKQLMEKSENDNEELQSYLGVFVQIFQRIHSYCSQAIYNIRVLYKQNILKRLLDGFASAFKICDPKFRDFQVTVLALFSLVAKTHLSAKELQIMIDFIKVKTAPTDLFVKTLLKLVSGIRLQPTFLLSYPTLLKIQEYSQDYSSDSEIGNDFNYTPEKSFSQQIHDAHRENTLPSAWAATSVVLPMPTHIPWHSKNKNFAFSLWIRVDSKNDTVKMNSNNHHSSLSENDTVCVSSQEENVKSEKMYHCWGENLHMLSFGSSQLLFEVWINPSVNCLVFRVSVSNNEGYTVLTEVSSVPVIVFGLWHFMTVNVIEKCDKKKIETTVELCVDGLIDQIIELEYSIFAQGTVSYVLLGQSCTINEFQGFTGMWHFANMMLFRDKVFTKETSLQLYALGPEFDNITLCDWGNEDVFIAPHISPSLLRTGINWDILMGDEKKNANINSLRENIVLIYCSKKSSEFLIFPHSTSLATEVVGSLAQILPVINNLRSLSSLLKPSQMKPVYFPVTHLSSKNLNLRGGIDTAVLNIGGISVFMFLFAWVIECSDDEKCQADSLQLVFHLIEKNPLHADTFHRLDGYNLVFNVIYSKKCKPSIHLLKVLLDSCVSTSILDHEIGSGFTKIIDENEALITNVDLLYQVVFNWRLWDHGNSDLLRILFAWLNTLLRENHPFKKFNFQQLQSIYMMDIAILICKDRFYYEEKLFLNPTTSKLILKLISKLALNPPINTNFVMAICDLLLMLHKDTSAYVSSSAPGFYYIMCAFTGLGSSKLGSLPKSWKNGSAKRNKVIINEEIKQRSNSISSVAHEDIENILPAITSSLNDVEEKESTNVAAGCDEVDRKIHEAENNLSSAIWYASLNGSREEGEDESDTRHTNCNTSFDDQNVVKHPHRSSSAIPVPSSTSSEFYIGGGSYVIVDDEDMVFGSVGFSDKQKISSSHATTPEIIASAGTKDWDLNLKDSGNYETEETNALVVISVLDAYLKRANEEQINCILKKKAFHMLANQLYLYPVTQEIIDACFSIVQGQEFYSFDLHESFNKNDVKSVQLQALVPIFSLLPKTNDNIQLCHNIITTLSDILSNLSHLTWSMVDLGLNDSVILLLLRILHDEQMNHNIVGAYQHGIIFSDIKHLIDVLTVNVMSNSGSVKFQALSDLLHLLSHCERQEMIHCGLYILKFINYLIFYKRCLKIIFQFATKNFQPIAINMLVLELLEIGQFTHHQPTSKDGAVATVSEHGDFYYQLLPDLKFTSLFNVCKLKNTMLEEIIVEYMFRTSFQLNR